MHGTMIKKRNP